MRRIDLHAHLTPPGYVDELPPQIEIPDCSPQALLETMARYEIDAAVVSLPPPGVFFGDQGAATALARRVNEHAARVVEANAGRLGALACLPLPDLDAALGELSHALDVLRLDGVALLTNVGGTYLGNSVLDPLLEELDRRGAYAFVHPTTAPYAPPLPQWPIWLFEFPFETTRVIVDLAYSGAFERYRRIRWQFPHLGGTAPFLANRIASLGDREPSLAAHAPAGALVYLERLYYDTGLSNHASGLASTLEVTTLDHVLFGTDWPFAALPSEGSDPAPGLAWLGAGRERVESTNAAALVPRLCGAQA
jgi:predicted TIM-barrel fold metal-dependent hydrolase